MKAYAKINLSLHVAGKQPDGYHDIDSVMLPLELHDLISVEEAIEISVEINADIKQENNLAFKAASLLKQEKDVKQGAKIKITKQIPIGSGLGGGSSNAAATLTLLNQFWNLSLSQEQLHEYAARLGSDVPFFINSIPAYAKGRGEKLTPVEFPVTPILLVLPEFSVSTIWAYNARTNETDVQNDFFPVIAKKHPEIIEIRKQLLEAGARVASLTGTGSALFGTFETTKEAAEAAKRFEMQTILTSSRTQEIKG